MQPDLLKYLTDIQQALTELQEFKGTTLVEYQAAGLARRGIEREFITIGEAMSHMLHRFPEAEMRIDHARRIANFRHILVHAYGEVDDSIVWDILTNSVPLLRKQVENWIAELGES
jgi:uncharacterized protein with HEPN domain